MGTRIEDGECCRAPETPKTWRDMTPEEKGALLLAHHEGKVVQCATKVACTSKIIWQDCPDSWKPSDDLPYRVRPEPKRETVTLYGGFGPQASIWMTGKRGEPHDTHSITFDVIDGKPDLASIRMEQL